MNKFQKVKLLLVENINKITNIDIKRFLIKGFDVNLLLNYDGSYYIRCPWCNNSYSKIDLEAGFKKCYGCNNILFFGRNIK